MWISSRTILNSSTAECENFKRNSPPLFYSQFSSETNIQMQSMQFVGSTYWETRVSNNFKQLPISSNFCFCVDKSSGALPWIESTWPYSWNIHAGLNKCRQNLSKWFQCTNIQWQRITGEYFKIEILSIWILVVDGMISTMRCANPTAERTGNLRGFCFHTFLIPANTITVTFALL